MNEKIKQYQNKLFNKLFLTLPNAKKFVDTQNEFDFDEPITHFYSYPNKNFWFSKSENEDKFIFIFGLNDDSLKNISISDKTLIIDFDKNEQFNNNSLGMFSVENSKIHILINYNILQYRYPYFNMSDFQIRSFKSLDNNFNMKIIDLGSLNEDFIENLEKFIKLFSELKTMNNNDEEIIDKKVNNENTQNQCPICLKDKDNIKLNPNLKNLKNLKPELCANCIEKIVAYEFYTKLTPLIKGNEKKYLDIAKEKYGNDQVFDIGLKLLEKYNIIRYIGAKKSLFGFDENSQVLSEYKKYSDENDLLIDNILQVKKATTKKNQNKNTPITKETTQKMNLFINSLKAGKTHHHACQIAKIDSKEADNWYNLGKRGDANYIQFYNNYKIFKPENVERLRKMEIFLDTLKEEDNIDNALKKSDLKFEKVRAWYGLGEKGDENYKDFYLACKILLPEGIPKKDNKKLVSNDELMNEFIILIEDGKTNAEAIEELKIPKFKVTNFINQGKLGNKKYVDFYNAYMIEVEKEKQLKEAKKQEKLLEKQEKASKQNVINLNDANISQNNEKTCKICGRTLSNKSNKDICKRCLRKQYASKIILRLLNSIEPEKPFKKEDLKVLNLQNIQIQDYIWTLKEFNLLDEENNKLKLKSKKKLEEFIKESGLNVAEIPQEKTTIKLNKTCKTCGKTLEISKFFSSETSEDGFEDNCKECKRKITTAGYLKEIIEIMDYESEFTEDDLKPYFKNPIQLQAKIWALIDNDLLKKDLESNTITLTDEKTAKEFLDKYYDEKTDKSKITAVVNYTETKDIPPTYTKKDQMEIVINEIKQGKSRKEAAKIANIPLYKINHWFNEGKQGYGTENIQFYKQLKKLEYNNEINNIKLKERMEDVLNELKAGNVLSKFETDEMNEWVEKGKNNEEIYVDFLKEYEKITNTLNAENLKNNDDEESPNELDNETQNVNDNIDIPQIETEDSISSFRIQQMNKILYYLAKGSTEKEAVNKANLTLDTYKYWIRRGKVGFGDLYIQFYKNLQKVTIIRKENKQNQENTKSSNNKIYKKTPDIYDPLPEKYIKSFKEITPTGIAWVIQSENQFAYRKNENGININIYSDNLRELFEKVINKNQIWGIIDYEKARNLIEPPEKIDDTKNKQNNETKFENEIKDMGIYNPLPKEYEESFKSTKTNKTGIAWVNRYGNFFSYSKSNNGQHIHLKDEDIYGLYEKVKKANQIWGIRDYEKAKKIIDFPENFEIPEILNVTKKEKAKKIIDFPEILNVTKKEKALLNPLPREYYSEIDLNNNSGFAWVNKIDTNWVYEKEIYSNIFKFSDPDIYKLHELVIKNNHIWGVIDLDKATKSLHISSKVIIKDKENKTDVSNLETKQTEPEYSKNIIKENSNIYDPLPQEYLETFPKQSNQTGIAWVNKIGNQFIYSRNVNKKNVKITDYSIKGLYKKVINQNQIWGIRNYSYAREFIDIPDDFEIPERYRENELEINTDIYAPLPNEFSSKYNHNKTKTGIAWVNKYGLNWVYLRQINGKTIRFTDEDIHKLHEKVIKNHQIWGIVDYEKAKKIIGPNKIETEDKEEIETEIKKENETKPSNISSNVTVTYIEKEINEFNIIISGTIKNRELIDILTRLKLFEEDFKRIVTTSINNQLDIFIELNINKYLIKTFEEKIEDLNWKINK